MDQIRQHRKSKHIRAKLPIFSMKRRYSKMTAQNQKSKCKISWRATCIVPRESPNQKKSSDRKTFHQPNRTTRLLKQRCRLKVKNLIAGYREKNRHKRAWTKKRQGSNDRKTFRNQIPITHHKVLAMTHAYRDSSRNIYNYNNRNARFIPHRQFCLQKKGPRGAVIPPSASCRQRSGAYPSVLNILRACKRERERERRQKAEEERGEGTDPGRERRGDRKKTRACSSRLSI